MSERRSDWRSRIPSVFRSVRFRLSALYSAVVFGLGGLILALVYLAVRWQLTTQTETRLFIRARELQLGQFRFLVNPQMEEAQVRTMESLINQFVLEKLAIYSLIGLGALFVISLVVGWILAGRALAPVDRITQVAREIEVSDLSRRIALEGPDDELTRLGATFDSMLDRLQGAFQSQKRFLADTSHDLRTPLSVIRSNVEVTLDDPQSTIEDWKATGEIVTRNVGKMGSMIEGLLAAARFEAGQATMVAVDLAGLVRGAADDQRAAAADVEVDLQESVEAVEVQGEPLSLGRALGNLVDNAIRVAPPGSKIEMGCGRRQGWVYLAVADDGPGFSGGDGTGLGLGIVEQVTKMHRGAFEIFSDQGATMVMWLPDGSETACPDFDPLRGRPGPMIGFNGPLAL
ncbi:MAG: HAMP domain-containing protein [Acidimicrobiia bacterium]|nr:HAMP domain-containing protein [Acidimicrobiia bacterium]